MWARVSATYLYPVKACAPLRVDALAFGPSGELHGDRQWVVVDADDRLTWQGAIPTLARILPAGTPDRLAIASAAGDSLTLPPPGAGAPRTVHSWNGQRQAFDALAGHDAGDAVAELASTIAGQRIRLVHLTTTAHLPNPVHIISRSSLHALTAAWEPSADPLRFRPNIILSEEHDSLPAFAEEQATALRCLTAGGPLVLEVTAPCERCVVVNVDPASATLDARYLQTVAAHSRGRGVTAPAAFGIYARATAPGSLATGDRLELVTRRA